MITVGDVIGAIEEFAPLSVQEKWDNSGLCVGSEDAPVNGILLGLDCTPELVDEAGRKGCVGGPSSQESKATAQP